MGHLPKKFTSIYLGGSFQTNVYSKPHVETAAEPRLELKYAWLLAPRTVFRSLSLSFSSGLTLYILISNYKTGK